jgi:hypothetical protein
MKTTILLNSGNYFDYDKLSSEIININDIANGLAMICRFGGQCDQFYSVAEHSIWISFFVPKALALCGLLHDASESVLGDTPKPRKNKQLDYVKDELELEINIAKQYNIPFPYPPIIKEIDQRMLLTERSQLFKNYKIGDKWAYEDKHPLPIKLCKWKPSKAKEMFIARYEDIVYQRHLKLNNYLA